MSSSVGHRAILVGALPGLLALLLSAAAAFACAPQAEIELSPTAAPPRSVVTVKGSDFSASGNGIRVYLGSPSDGRLVATATVHADRSFTATFTVPDVAPGQHVVSATQTDLSGVPIGSPANAVLEVQPAPEPPTTTSSTTTTSTTTTTQVAAVATPPSVLAAAPDTTAPAPTAPVTAAARSTTPAAPRTKTTLATAPAPTGAAPAGAPPVEETAAPGPPDQDRGPDESAPAADAGQKLALQPSAVAKDGGSGAPGLVLLVVVLVASGASGAGVVRWRRARTPR